MSRKRQSINKLSEPSKKNRNKNESDEDEISSVENSENSNSNVTAGKNNFNWCKKYPGSIVSLSKPKGTYKTKLVSWNVNGLRAWLKTNGLKYLYEENSDVLAIQEIKCGSVDIPKEAKATGYSVEWNPAEKKGYAGTGIYCKHKPLSIVKGIGKKQHDNEGRVITTEFEKFYLVSAYVPNSGRGLVNLEYRTKEWDVEFQKYMKGLDAHKPVILCGDLNVSHNEIDLANPKTNRRTAGFTDEERAGFSTLLKELDFVDSYRELYPDREEAYTFWNYMRNAREKNVGWRLDYFVLSRRLMPHVVDQEIRCGVSGSDHCPIVLYLDI